MIIHKKATKSVAFFMSISLLKGQQKIFVLAFQD